MIIDGKTLYHIGALGKKKLLDTSIINAILANI